MAVLVRVTSGILAALLLLFGLGVTVVWVRYGGGGTFPDRSGVPELSDSVLEVVADLDLPPGNVAVSAQGRVFMSYHPEAHPPVQVAELQDGTPRPYPPGGLPAPLAYQSVLSLRVDRQDRLWVLDNASHGTGTPRLLGFDLGRDELIHDYDFPGAVAGIGSHLNDFQVSPDGRRIYIADASIFALEPALVLYDVERRTSRRVLEGHPSVTPEAYVPVVQGRRMLIFGVFAIRPGVDSIALDRRGEWLYFAPVTSRNLFRVRRADLDDWQLPEPELRRRVEVFAPKTMSDGITTDVEDNLYLTDPEHSAIAVLGSDGTLRTLVASPRLRWPDGFSFGPDGWLYVTASSLHHVIMRGSEHVRAQAPYQIFRFKPGVAGIPGH